MRAAADLRGCLTLGNGVKMCCCCCCCIAGMEGEGGMAGPDEEMEGREGEDGRQDVEMGGVWEEAQVVGGAWGVGGGGVCVEEDGGV